MNWFLSWSILTTIWTVHLVVFNQPLWWFLIIIITFSFCFGNKIFRQLGWWKLGLGIFFFLTILTHSLIQNNEMLQEAETKISRKEMVVQQKYSNFYILQDQLGKNHYLGKMYYAKGQKQTIEMNIYDQIQFCYKSEKITNSTQKKWLWSNYQVKNKIYLQNKNCPPKITQGKTWYNQINNYLKKNNSATNQKWINFLLFQQTDLNFQQTKRIILQLGIIHLFVISGFHLLIFSKIWFGIAKKTQHKWLQNILEGIGLLFCLFLVYLTNWKFSASKSFCLIGFLWINTKLKLNYQNKQEQISLIIFVFLLINPLLFYQTGFQLSCLASWFLFTNKKEPKIKWKQKLIQINQKNFLILMVLFPILINIQHQISLFTILYVFCYSLLILILYPLFFFFIWWKWLWPVWKYIFLFLEKSLFWIVNWDVSIPFGYWSNWTISIYYCLGIMCFWLKRQTKLKLFLIMVWISNLIIITWINWNDSYYQLHLINVGHGLAIFLQSPNKNTNILFDAGIGKAKINQSNRIQKYLQKLAVNKLDTIFISHNHTDHYNNLNYLLTTFPTDQIITNQQQKNNYQVNELHFQNLAYSYYQEMIKENNQSLVLQTVINQHSILFTFDLEKEGEEKLIQKQILTQTDILLVGHHGAKNSSTKTFLEKLRPQYCLISSNQNIPKAMNNLKKIKCKIYNTKNKNNIVLTFKNKIEVTWN